MARFRLRLAPAATPAARLIAPVTELADLAACPRRFHLRHEIGLEDHPTRAREIDDDSPAGELDPQARGTLAHRLLERLDFAAYRRRGLAALDDLLRAEGLPPPLSTDAAEVRDRVVAFLATPFGAALIARPADEVRREVPFAFATGGSPSPAPRLLVKGQMDLVIAGAADDSITVLDYKLARAADSPNYRFQLLAYAAAARALWRRNESMVIRSGLVFLADRDPTPRIEEVTGAELDAFVGRLEGLATTLADARRLAEWPGRERAMCDALHCGYVERCHPAARASGATAR